MEQILEKIHRAGLKLLSPLTTDETYRIIVEEAVWLIGGDYGLIVTKQGGKLERSYVSAQVAFGSKAHQKGLADQVMVERKARIVHLGEIAKASSVLKGSGICSTIFIPLTYHNETLGVLAVNSKQDVDFGQSELDMLKLFGSLASLAVRKTQLYEETKNALEIRDRFISMAAHELRTPLTSVSGYIQLLNNRLAGEDSVESRWSEQLLRESQRLTALVDELLAINRIRSGKWQYEWRECLISQLVEKTVHKYSSLYPNRRIIFVNSLSSERQDLVIGDCDKLLQVLSRIIDNAIKFSPEGSDVIIRLGVTQKFVVTEIVDHGAGISKKELQRIFDDFYKVDENLKEGMGLGLSIARTIIKEHRGTIAINSKLKVGTKIKIKLPRANLSPANL